MDVVDLAVALVSIAGKASPLDSQPDWMAEPLPIRSNVPLVFFARHGLDAVAVQVDHDRADAVTAAVVLDRRPG